MYRKMEVFQLCQRNAGILIITFVLVLTFSRRSMCVQDLSGLRTILARNNQVFEIRGDESNGVPIPLTNNEDTGNDRGVIPRIHAVKLKASKDEPSLGESWNITCTAQVYHNTRNKSQLNLIWRSGDGGVLLSNENTRMNELRSMITTDSIFAETYVRIHRLLPSHDRTYQCVAQYMDLEQVATYTLDLQYDTIHDFSCLHQSDCPESMHCNLNRCTCNTNHPVLITSIPSKNDRLCYPVAELGYFCHQTSQCEKSTMNSVCLKNICQCRKGYAMTAKIMQSGSTQFSCELQDSVANDKQSAYRGIMIASACFGVIFLLVVAAFPVRQSCGSKCALFRGRYQVDRSGRRLERRRPRSLSSLVSQVSLSAQNAEKPPSYEEVVGSGGPFEDAPPSYDSLGIRWSAERNEELNIPSPVPFTLSPCSPFPMGEQQPRPSIASSNSGWTVIPLTDNDASIGTVSRTPSPTSHSTPITSADAVPSVNIKVQ